MNLPSQAEMQTIRHVPEKGTRVPVITVLDLDERYGGKTEHYECLVLCLDNGELAFESWTQSDNGYRITNTDHGLIRFAAMTTETRENYLKMVRSAYAQASESRQKVLPGLFHGV